MPLTINTNMASIQSERALAMNRGNMETAMQRLSSGKRINSALDDASGLAVANRMRNQIEGLNMAIRNANDGISLAQTAEGAMEELQNILLRMRELAIQASNGTYTDEDRSYIAAEFDELMKEMRRVSNQAAWDGDVKLIAEGARAQQVQVGINAADYIQIPLQSLTVEDINLSTKFGVNSSEGVVVDRFDFVGLVDDPVTEVVPTDATGDAIKDVRFERQPLPNFQLKLWNGARDADGKAESGPTGQNVLTATGAASVQDLIKQLKAHPNYDSTTCDLQFKGGKLEVVWKIAGQRDPDTSLTLTNGEDNESIIIDRSATSTDMADAQLIEATSTNPAYYQQTFDLKELKFHRDIVPKSAGNFFSVQIGNRVLTADNVVDVVDLARKLQADSDYSFVRAEVGLGDSPLQLFETTRVGGTGLNADGSDIEQLEAASAEGEIYKNVSGLFLVNNGTDADTLAGNVSGNSINQSYVGAPAGEIATISYGGADWQRVYKIAGSATTAGFAGNVSGRPVTQTRAAAQVGEIYKDVGGTGNYAIKTLNGSSYANDTSGSYGGVTGAITLNTALVDSDSVAQLDYAQKGIQTLKINFGENATSRAFLYQSRHNVTITDTKSAVDALDFVDAAAKVVNESRARMGATMSRIEYTINNLMNLVENTEEAKSRVLDTDYAKESAELAKAQILAQAGTAMLAQANQSQQYVLNLLRQG